MKKILKELSKIIDVRINIQLVNPNTLERFV